MFTTPQPFWVWFTPLLQTAAVGLLTWVAWRLLFADRAKGRRRCPKCWYDMSWTDEMRCSECGFTSTRDRDFRRTRRRGVPGALCMLAAVVVALWMGDAINQRGWTTYLPDGLLVRITSPTADPGSPLRRELEIRMTRRSLSDAAWLHLLEAHTVDAELAPPSDEWIEAHGAFAQRMAYQLVDRGTSDSAKLRAATIAHDVLTERPPAVTLTQRSHWPIDVAPQLGVSVHDWIALPGQLRVTLSTSLDGSARDVHVKRRHDIQARSYTYFLPPLPPGTHEFTVTADIERRHALDGAWEPAGRVVLPATLTVDAAATLEPHADPAVDELVRRVFAGGIVKWASGSLPVRVNVDPRSTYAAVCDGLAIGARAEVRRNGTPVRQLELWWEAGTTPSVPGRQHAWEVPMLDDVLLAGPHAESDIWTIHVRGDRAVALRVDGPTRYWDGAFEVEVSVTPREGAAPSRGWIPESLLDGEGTWPVQ